MVREEAVLSALRRRAVWQRYGHLLKPGHFSDTDNRRLFAHLAAAHAKGEAIPEGTLRVPLPPVPEDYAAQLEDFIVRAQLTDLAAAAHHQLGQPGLLTPTDLAEVLRKAPGFEAAAGADVFERIVGQGKRHTRRTRLPSGLGFLDEALGGGVAPGELVMIGAPPYGGKTHWLVKLATGYAGQGLPVYHFSLEDAADTDVLGYYQAAIRQLPAEQHDRAHEYVTILDYADTVLTPAGLDAALAALIGRKPSGPSVVVVDYGDLVKVPAGRSDDPRRDRIAESFEAQRRLGNKYHAIYLTGTQATARAWKRKYLDMGDLADAKVGKARVADVIVMVSQVPVEKLEGVGRLIITKARGRKVDSPTIDFRADWSTFEVQGACRA